MFVFNVPPTAKSQHELYDELKRISNTLTVYVFQFKALPPLHLSSPEPKAQRELLRSLDVRRTSRVFNYCFNGHLSVFLPYLARMMLI